MFFLRSMARLCAPLCLVCVFCASSTTAQEALPVSERADAVSANPMSATAPTPQADEPGELRGMWVVRNGLTSPAAIRQVVATAAKYHLNALFVQVRGRGDAWYDSPHEPRAEALSRQPRDFDPLRILVAEAHSQGIQVHAWMNTYLTWSGKRAPSSPQHLWNAHRDWFACDRNGLCTAVPNAKREGAFLQPSHPQVQEHLFQVFTHVAKTYDVDGIHFDYCRYAGSDYDFSPATLARFRASLVPQLTPEDLAKYDARLKTDRLAYVHAFGKAWEEWRREQVTGLVTRITQTIKQEKPWMQITAAVFADARDACQARGQDWPNWLQAGVLDAVVLMAYDKRTERLLEQTREAVAAAGGRHIYTGIGAWRLSAHDVAKKIVAVRQAGATGVNLFSYNSVHTRPQYLETLRRGVFASRSAPPRMRWLPDRNQKPEEPGKP